MNEAIRLAWKDLKRTTAELEAAWDTYRAFAAKIAETPKKEVFANPHFNKKDGKTYWLQYGVFQEKGEWQISEGVFQARAPLVVATSLDESIDSDLGNQVHAADKVYRAAAIDHHEATELYGKAWKATREAFEHEEA